MRQKIFVRYLTSKITYVSASKAAFEIKKWV